MTTRTATLLSLVTLVACSARPTPAVFMFRGGFECGHMYMCRARGLAGEGTLKATLVFERSASSQCTVAGARVDEGNVIRDKNGDVVGWIRPLDAPPPDVVAWTCRRLEGSTPGSGPPMP